MTLPRAHTAEQPRSTRLRAANTLTLSLRQHR